ncbi:MAG: hypothetical protein DRR42_13585 [Gammaproteobacteria bacterium]|nr:MAG: hypothetical protein DRR42_13585 [Gammaproteobacteria bacterium]
MKRLEELKWLVVPLFMTVFAVGDANAGISDCQGSSFAGVGEQCVASDPGFVGGTVEYSFSVGENSGITGFTLVGDVAPPQGTYNLLGPDLGNGVFAASSGSSVNVLFDVAALLGVEELGAGIYKLTLIGFDSGTNYDLVLTSVPIPAAAWLFGSVLVALGVVGRKRSLGESAQGAVPA